MVPDAYHAGFCAIFILELKERHWPAYPEAPWFTALRQADHWARIGALRREVRAQYHLTGRQLYEREPLRPEPLVVAARSREARSIDAACDRFLEQRGIPVGDFHAY